MKYSFEFFDIELKKCTDGHHPFHHRLRCLQYHCQCTLSKWVIFLVIVHAGPWNRHGMGFQWFEFEFKISNIPTDNLSCRLRLSYKVSENFNLKLDLIGLDSLDNVDKLIPGFIQHGGDNVLPTVQAYIYEKNVDSVITADQDYELGLQYGTKMRVFIDF